VQFATSPAIADVLADLNEQGKATDPATAGFALQVKHSTGRFSGKIGASQSVARFAGVVLRKQQRAEGVISGAAIGTVTFAPAP
jgi:hypothetical protein